jgi:tRNA A37 threonylcarbamoyladenosine dehydratase
MTLIRSGIKKLRVVDYDIVTLSSLNRHAFALRSDVGKLKVRVVKEYAEKINPSLTIDAIDDAFVLEYAKRYVLEGHPDYILDCIDDLDAKCELIKFCQENNLKIISSMGAGAKCDPSCVRISNFHLVQGDKLAKRLRYMYKLKYGELIPNIKSVYSIEKSIIGLTDLEEHQKGNVELHRINENERVRSLPVFASIPAIFGQAIASFVLCELANMPIGEYKNEESLNQEVMIGNVNLKKLVEDFKKEEMVKRKIK